MWRGVDHCRERGNTNTNTVGLEAEVLGRGRRRRKGTRVKNGGWDEGHCALRLPVQGAHLRMQVSTIQALRHNKSRHGAVSPCSHLDRDCIQLPMGPPAGPPRAPVVGVSDCLWLAFALRCALLSSAGPCFPRCGALVAFCATQALAAAGIVCPHLLRSGRSAGCVWLGPSTVRSPPLPAPVRRPPSQSPVARRIVQRLLLKHPFHLHRTRSLTCWSPRCLAWRAARKRGVLLQFGPDDAAHGDGGPGCIAGASEGASTSASEWQAGHSGFPPSVALAGTQSPEPRWRYIRSKALYL